MLAVIKHIMDPETKALKATFVTTDRFPGAIALSDAIIMPNELGLPNPHTAYVAIAALRS